MALPQKTQDRVKRAAAWILETKEKGGKVAVVVGSGPNLHEGVTTLIAELIHKGIVDGVCTSSAVVSHEMAGTLEKVKRVKGETIGHERALLPADGFVEVSLLSEARLREIQREISIDLALYRSMRRAKGNVIIKAAGNIAYPTGLRTETLAHEIQAMAEEQGVPFEQIAGYGADPHTMLGAGARNRRPVLVTVPQLVGGGRVGLAIGDSLSISERCKRVAELLASADVIIESAIALAQEIHDGPFETFTGHGIWSAWEGQQTYSLSEKKVIRIDLDPNLEKAWTQERKSKKVSDAVHKGLPKTKLMRIPFRMEMSGFSRIPGSLPIIGDIGVIWPLLANRVAKTLGIKLDFMSYPQSTPAGREVREWIVRHIQPISRERLMKTRGMPWVDEGRSKC
ncbi:MAG: hypothetical protein HGA50_11110 [Deltaproteobacteria bacterium]|nr:hypothetical protein [Deltaproteobacteria bacterium]